MVRGKKKGVGSTRSSAPAETSLEKEVRELRQTVADMNKNMAEMRAQ